MTQRAHAHPFEAYRPARLPAAEALARAAALHAHLDARRSVRWFSPDPVPAECIEWAVRCANTAPSGAHHQPWRFVAVGDPAVRHAIREAAEVEERLNYEGGRITEEWRAALAPLETGSDKSYLDVAPWLVVCFAEKATPRPDGSLRKNYYVNESVGIACGLFIEALHTMGLATLTHTPNPMAFLSRILGRPAHERPYILFPVGYPAADCEVPRLDRKPLAEALEFVPPRGA
ncbi:oxidoreductase [Pilimelia anulata]|uniref:Oxidoreductase n=1 Tax=Pilimelia anulata TaxID=53371 RepID=A0A8J3FD45_9ACTN|nr:nitroreductase family protein [Pilimelia anulata]GGK02893.1 oxidoreductase [Pilimelia anulata]